MGSDDDDVKPKLEDLAHSSELQDARRRGVAHINKIVGEVEDRRWPVETHLTRPEGGTKIGLKMQHPTVRRVLSAAIDNVEASVLWKDAFPDPVISEQFARESLLDAAKQLGIVSIAERLRTDTDYVTTLAFLVRYQKPCLSPV